MKVLLLLTVCGSIMVTVGLLGLYAQVTVRLKKLEHDLKDYRRDTRKNYHDIKILKERAASESDKIIITHEYSQKDAPNYGGF